MFIQYKISNTFHLDFQDLHYALRRITLANYQFKKIENQKSKSTPKMNKNENQKIFYISDDDPDDVYNNIYNLSYYDHLFGEDNHDDDLNYDADHEDNIDGNNDSDDESSIEMETSRNDYEITDYENDNNDNKSEDNNVENDEYQFSQCYDLNLSDLNSLELEYMADIYKIESPQTISSDYDDQKWNDKECDLPINPIRRAKSCPILENELRRN